MWTILRRIFARKHSRRPHEGGKRRRPRFEALEDRLVPTTTLWLDFGDNFPAHSTSVPGAYPPVFTTEFYLDMTVQQLRTTLSGPDLRSSTAGALLDSDTVRFTPFADEVTFDYNGDGRVDPADADQLRAAVMDLVTRYYEPFDIDIRVGEASNLAAVTAALAANSGSLTGRNDAYVFVTGARSLAAARPVAPSLYGMAGGTDFVSARNLADDSAAVFINNLFAAGFNNQNADTALARTAAHEAGHTYGLRHTISAGAGSAPILAQSDIMARGAAGMVQRLNLNFFTRYPLPLAEVWADGATSQNSYSQLAGDLDIGVDRLGPAYVTGTGAADIITLTRLSDTRATVQVQPLTGSPIFTYTINTTNGVLVDAGFGDDQVIVDARILRNIHVRGMAGVDVLEVRGQPTMSNNYYEPDAATVAGLDGATSYGGQVVTGFDASFLPPRPTITFAEFEPASSVRAAGYIHFTFVTPREHWDSLEISCPDAGEERVAGFGISADRSSTVTYVPLIVSDVPNLYVETNTLPDTITVLCTSSATTISTGEGSDWIDVGSIDTRLDGIRAAVTVLGGIGGAELWLHDYGAFVPGHIYTVTSDAVTRSGIANIYYDTAVSHVRLNAGWGNDTVNVRSTSLVTPVTVSLKAGGADTVNVGNTDNSLDSIQGPLTILAEVGTTGVVVDSVKIMDQGDLTANTYTLAVEYYTRPDFAFPLVRGTVARNDDVLITYNGGLTSLVLNAGQQSDTIHVQSTAELAPLTVNAGAGDDTIFVGFKSSVADIRGRLHINGQYGWDKIVIDDRADSSSSLFDDFGVPIRRVWRDNGILLTCEEIEALTILD